MESPGGGGGGGGGVILHRTFPGQKDKRGRLRLKTELLCYTGMEEVHNDDHKPILKRGRYAVGKLQNCFNHNHIHVSMYC